ncbi:MAG: PaaI family thioesterase [Firmicutes bacterium]|nr:PaaI family thioesterase [Bacillota bacterium]
MEQEDSVFWQRARRLETGPVWRLFGMSIVNAEEGVASVSMPITPAVFQQLGHVHGGVLMTLLDSAMAAGLDTRLTEDWTAVTSQLNTHFLRPASGAYLTATGRVLRLGSHLAVTQGEVRDSSGQLVTAATAQFFLIARADNR